MTAVGEADGCARLDRTSREQFGTTGHGIGHDADARHVVSNGQAATMLKVADRERRVQQGVVNHLRDVAVRGIH